MAYLKFKFLLGPVKGVDADLRVQFGVYVHIADFAG